MKKLWPLFLLYNKEKTEVGVRGQGKVGLGRRAGRQDPEPGKSLHRRKSNLKSSTGLTTATAVQSQPISNNSLGTITTRQADLYSSSAQPPEHLSLTLLLKIDFAEQAQWATPTSQPASGGRSRSAVSSFSRRASTPASLPPLSRSSTTRGYAVAASNEKKRQANRCRFSLTALRQTPPPPSPATPLPSPTSPSPP